MKKETINFILILVLLIVPIVYLSVGLVQTNNALAEVNKTTQNILNGGEVDDIRGNAAIINSTAEVVLALGSGVMAALIGGFSVFSIIIFVISIIARILIKDKSKKNVYRVLMTIVYALFALLGCLFIGKMTPVIIIYLSMIIVCLAVNMYNTYSNSMYEVKDNLIKENK